MYFSMQYKSGLENKCTSLLSILHNVMVEICLNKINLALKF